MFPDIITNLLFIALGILGIGLLIGFHELGHFIFAKIFRVSTPSFSIGMGPKIFKKNCINRVKVLLLLLLSTQRNLIVANYFI